MYLYRGENIGNRERLTDTCLRVILSGDSEKIFDILPHIRVLRSNRLLRPLVELLAQGRLEQKVAAAAALGSLGDPECIAALRKAYNGTGGPSKRVSGALKSAIISALGEVPIPDAVQLLGEINRSDEARDSFKSRRTALVIGALGHLAQQGVGSAETELIHFLTDEQPANRALAATELSLSYWHRPDRISGALLHQLFDLTCDRSDEVCTAAAAALLSLAKLGNSRAEFLVGHLPLGEPFPLEEERY